MTSVTWAYNFRCQRHRKKKAELASFNIFSAIKVLARILIKSNKEAGLWICVWP